MTLVADSAGVISGHFTVPTGIPSGNKEVVVLGAGGSTGRAVFSGQGTLERQQWQQQTSETEFRWTTPPPANLGGSASGNGGGSDPLAQTFSLARSIQLAAVDLFFSAAPTSRARIQIRETTAGFPNQNVVAESIINPASIVLAGAATTVAFAWPVTLIAGVEYALVILCDDAVGSLFVAELGKFDAAAQAWVTVQPYNIGVLLSSSNASTWTAHQDRDLTFRLRAAAFTETTRTINMGKITVAGATDLLLMTYAERPASATNVEYKLTLPDASMVTISDGEPVKLPAAITGDVLVSARLTGTAGFSPVQQPGTQVAVGVMATTGTYVTRAVPAGTAVKLKVIYEAVVPSGATVRAYYKGPDIGDSWIESTDPVTRNVDDGFVEFAYTTTGITELTLQVKLVLSGTPAARPRVRDLRVIVMS